MLRRDHALRLSDDVQARYAACRDDVEAKERVTRSVQRQVAREAGFTVTTEGVELLQSAVALFPFDQELVDSCFYLKNNIHMPCPIPVGAVAPRQLRLHRLDGPGETRPAGRRTTIGELVSDAPLTALIAGSLT